MPTRAVVGTSLQSSLCTKTLAALEGRKSYNLRGKENLFMQKEEYKRRIEGQTSTLAHQEQEHSALTGCHAGSSMTASECTVLLLLVGQSTCLPLYSPFVLLFLHKQIFLSTKIVWFSPFQSSQCLCTQGWLQRSPYHCSCRHCRGLGVIRLRWHPGPELET